jgi:hypothetical protein
MKDPALAISAAFKANVAVVAIKGHRTLVELSEHGIGAKGKRVASTSTAQSRICASIVASSSLTHSMPRRT